MNDRPRGRRRPPPVPPALSLSLRMQSRRWSEVAGWRERVAAAAEAALAVAPVQPARGAEVSVLMTDDRRIRVINRDWRGFDKATNVLSFPAVPPSAIATSPALGDIVIAYETVLREAADEEKSVDDHLSHLVVHGLLHLLGEDHETDAEAERMERLEIAALARLGIADPYAGSDPVPGRSPQQDETPTQP